MQHRERVLRIVAFTFAVLTLLHVGVWKSDLTLWTDTVRVTPCVIRPHLQRALSLAAEGIGGDDLNREWVMVMRLTNGATCVTR